MRIYISYTNRCDYKLVHKVKNYLKDKGHQVLNYNPAHKYSTDKLFQSEVVIVMTHNYPYVGKGVYTEIKLALKNYMNLYVYKEEFVFAKLFSVSLHNNQDWTNEFGKLNELEPTVYFVG